MGKKIELPIVMRLQYFQKTLILKLQILKEVNFFIDTKESEKEKVTTILGDVSKLEPLMIFKGKRGKNVGKDLQTNENDIKKQMRVYSQGNSWVDAEFLENSINTYFQNMKKKLEKNVYL